MEFDESSLFAESRLGMDVGEKFKNAPAKDAPAEDDREDDTFSLPVPDPPTAETGVPSVPSPPDTGTGEIPEIRDY